MPTERRNALVGTVLLLVLAAWSMTRMRVTTDITHFLPEGRADEDLTLARELAFGELSRTMVLVVRTDTASSAADISREFEHELRQEPRVAERLAFLQSGPPQGVEEALWELYSPRTIEFTARDADGARAAITDAALERAVRSLRDQLALPISSLLSRVAPRDPLLTLPALLERLNAGRGAGLGVLEGRFVIDGGRSAVLFCATRAPSSDNAHQRPFLAGIEAAFERVNVRHGGTLNLEQSGSNRYGVRMEDSIQRDIRRVSIGSAVLLALLFLAVFRSLRLFVLVLPVFGAGFLGGIAACTAMFGQVHGITLAFGAALIGVSADYAVHFHCNHLVAPDERGPRATMRRIWPGLVLGAATTVVGFAALIASTFPGLRELAIFGAAGITTALLATRLLLPALAAQRPHVGSSRIVARIFGGWMQPRMGERRGARWPRYVGFALVAALLAIGLPRARWDDAIANLNRLDPELLAADEAVRARVTRFDARRIAVSVGVDEQAALEVNDRAADVLARAEADGIIEGSWTAANLLPSASRQREVGAVLREDETLWPRVRAALDAQGFVADAFEPFHAALAASPPEPLVWSDLANGALAPLVRPFRIDVPSVDEAPGRVAFLGFVRGVTNADALRNRLESVGARLVDVEAELTGAYSNYRRRMSALLGVGIVCVVLLVALRHSLARPRRGVLRATAAACVPAILAALSTVAILGLCGIPLNMLTLVALLMVVSMGVDYGIFFVEASSTREEMDATCLGIFVAAVSTLFGFGLLAFSAHPALHGMGLTAGVGILLSLVLATIMRDVIPRAEE